jgi:ribonucleoside-diphosphate reductase alpha chain
MRSLQFAGKPIELNNARIYNCAYLPAKDMRFFSELLFLLLSGAGVGYSVQKHHVAQIPTIKAPKKLRRYVVEDSLSGWAEAVKILMKSYVQGHSRPVFDYSQIRPKGARLITAGGKAPGPAPLKMCLTKLESILEQADNRKLTTLEVHEIACHIADAVLSGGRYCLLKIG